MLQVVDGALRSATEARKKTSKEADEEFKRAIVKLSDYEKKYHSRESVTHVMAEAEEKDKSSSTVLEGVKQKFFRVREYLDLCFATY